MLQPQTIAAVAVASIYLILQRKRSNTPQDDDPNNTSCTKAGAAYPNDPSGTTSYNHAASRTPPDTIQVSSSSWAHIALLILLVTTLGLAGRKHAWDMFGLVLATLGLLLASQVSSTSSSRTSLRESSTGPLEAAQAALQLDPRLAGVWAKDMEASDNMDAACALMQLNGLVRTAVRLVRGMEVTLEPNSFEMAIFSVIAFFKVRERYALDGTPASFKRRDLRRGQHNASLAVQPDGGLVLTVAWPEPLSGTGTDRFVLADPHTLHVTSSITVHGQSTVYNTVYRRKP